MQKLTILAVDDQEDILFTLKAIGKTMGWQVHTENNGMTALQKAASLKPDIILIDYHMPNQDGLTIVKAIRKFDRIVPIIVLTVDERQEVAERFLSAGASDFANKPIKVADLAARINVHARLLEKQREFAAAPLLCDKGINPATLDLVRSYCQKAAGPFKIEDIAEYSGLAYQTTVRYLQYLLNKKELAVTSDYGKIGRPKNLYKYVGPR